MITIKPVNDSYYEGFVVEGHADYAAHGQDIVCAGVSAIVIMSYMGVRGETDVELKQHHGYSRLRINGRRNMKTDTIIHAFIGAARILAKEYPSYIQIEGDDGI